MKIITVYIVTAIICCFSANAQVKFGVKAGISISTQDFKYGETEKEDLQQAEAEVKSLEGVCGGFFLNIPLPELPLSIQPELLYTQKGSETIATSGGQLYRRRGGTVHYVEVPVLIKYAFPVGGVTPNLFTGPFIDFEIVNGSRSDVGITAGGGIDFYLSHTLVTLDARYALGLTNIDPDYLSIYMEPGHSAKNRAWMIMLGAAF